MATPTNPIERLDVPVAEVEAQTAKSKVDLSVARLRWLFAHPVKADPAHLAEQRHCLVNVNPDSTVPEIVVSLIHPKRTRGGAS